MAHHPIVPSYQLEIGKIRKEQRRIAALLQRDDVNIYVPQTKRSSISQGYNNISARDGGHTKQRRPLHMMLPKLMRERSRSLSTLYGENDSSSSKGIRNRKHHPVEIPRLDPLSHEAKLKREAIRTKDIVRFSYESLNEREDVEIPSILRKPGVPPVDRNASFAMYVPRNTPLPLKAKIMQNIANNTHLDGIREGDGTHHGIGSHHASLGGRSGKGHGHQGYDTSTAGHIGHDGKAHSWCTCLSPVLMDSTTASNQYHRGPSSTKYMCANCGRAVSDTRVNYGPHRDTVRPGRESSFTTASRTNSGYPRGYNREDTGYSSNYRRMSTCSSFSEMDPTLVDDAWRDKIPDGVERLPSMLVKSFGRNNTDLSQSSEVQHDQRMDGRNISATENTKRLRFAGVHNGKSKKLSKTALVQKETPGDVNLPLAVEELHLNQEFAALEALRAPEPMDPNKIPSEAYRRAIAMAQKDKLPDDPAWFFDRITKPYVFSYFDPLKPPKCQCGDEHKTKDDGKVSKKAVEKRGDGKSKSKKKSKKKTEMKHIFGNVNIYDFYPGGKYNMR